MKRTSNIKLLTLNSGVSLKFKDVAQLTTKAIRHLQISYNNKIEYRT